MMRKAFLALLVLEAISPMPGHAQAQSASIDRPVTGPTYLRIPVSGAIGEEGDFTAGMMGHYLEKARELEPTVVILDIDTPGGSVPHAKEIVRLMVFQKDLRCVAFVRRAFSAGAIIALSCPEIYVTDTSFIGAATAYVSGPHRDEAVTEKFQSTWRAAGRMAAERGGHSPLLPEAMIDRAHSLTMRKEGEKIVLERDGYGQTLKNDGQILTLTPSEAVQCGLARGRAQNLEELRHALGFAEWSNIEGPEDDFAVNAPPAGQFYTMFAEEAESVGLTDYMTTSIQRKRSFDRFKVWLDRQALIGRRVGWSLRLIDADTDIGTWVIEQSQELVELAEANLRAQESTAYGTREVADHPGSIYRSTHRVLTPDGARRVREAKRVLEKWRRILGEAKRYPLHIDCLGPGHHKMKVFAQASESLADALARVPPGERLRIVGRIVDIQCGPFGCISTRISPMDTTLQVQ